MNTLFSDLLQRHPRLATWLMEMIQCHSELRAEALVPSFLLECARQGVPGNAYPFTRNDHGLADLRIFLQSIQPEEGVAQTTDGPPTGSAASLATVFQIEDDEWKNIPVTLSASGEPGEIDTITVARDAGGEPGDIDDTPVVHRISGDLREIDNTPIVRRSGMISRIERNPRIQPGESVTEHIPMFGMSPLSDKTAEQKNNPGRDEVERNRPLPDISDEPTPRVVALDKHGIGEDADEARKTWISTQETPRPFLRDCLTHLRRPRMQTPGRLARLRHPHTRRERLVSLVLLLVILGAILVPAGFLVGFGISAYTTYHDLSNRAHSAVDHLLAVKTIFSGEKSHLSALFNVAILQQAEQEFVASSRDFQQLQNQLQHSSTLHTIVTYLPQYRESLKSAQAASVIGMDVARIGQIVTARAIQFAPSFEAPLLSVSNKPLLTQPMLMTIGTTLDQVLPLLNDIQAHSQTLSLNALPISAHEKDQVGALLQLLPRATGDLSQARNLLETVGWLLGVGHPRTFLVQTMDRAELRATGGFTGQYGNLTINGGRVEPFNLRDISLVEYANNSNTYGQSAPAQYRSWWPFANWGMRDSNVSADFPTSARMALQLYQQEVGTQADGVISFTPVVIEHILNIIGPINVPGYNVTATSQNLEDLLHYYQLDNSGILKQIHQQPGDQETSTRKRFTNTLASLLMSKVRSAPSNELLAIAQQVFQDLKTKELQIYFTDPGAESLLMHYGYAGQMDRSTTHDGLYVVQENLSASKASQYVQTIMHDTVTLNNQGGATHVLQIRLVYQQNGPVYGYDTYFDYLRVYVPPNSQLLWGDGFEGSRPLCGGSSGACPVNGPYPNGELSCPAGQYQPGAGPPSLTGSDGSNWEPLHALVGPTNTQSDEPGRAMYGGWVIVPKNCTMNVTLSWYVPPMSQQPYSLLVQRQAGTFPEMDLTIRPNAAHCASLGTAGLHFDDILVKDASFTPAPLRARQQACSSARIT